MANILTLAAYERARRALRGVCEPNSRLKVVRTNISDKVSENKAKCARWVRGRTASTKQKKRKGPRKGVLLFLVDAAGLEPTVSSTRNWRDTTFATPRNMCFRLARSAALFPSTDYYSITFPLCQSENQIKNAKIYFARRFATFRRSGQWHSSTPFASRGCLPR